MSRSLPARFARWVVNTLLAAIVASILAVAAFRWLPVPVTAFMIGERLAAGASAPFEQRHEWVPWRRISPHAAVAVIAAEDQKFPFHDGFDFEQIEKAMADAGRGRRLRGASTISQQVAKNLFLWPGQTWVRKGLEAWFTVWIELFWPKRRVLEVYLNSAQFGHGIWGVEAASRAYFGKDAARLDRHEAALLAAVLPSPTRYRVVNSGPWVRERQAWIVGQMQRLGGPKLLDTL
ncbi:MAG TPA: monofunctional biosynthetic peptidoglycan transglycosylase [Steroidobacteraceae bacterium]|nr:monofunctional biosynthetic peptidoglycan transglycosylase [Steroidobacteraceae bacterium]